MTAGALRTPAPSPRRMTGAPVPAGPMGMASRLAPPFLLPGEHFTAALVFLALGAAGLVRFAEPLAAGAYPAPQLVAVTHLFTLGWITTSIMGALYQFLPVALGQPIRSVRLAHVSFGLFVVGLPVFVAGLLAVRPTIIVIGAAVFASGLLAFLGNVVATLVVARRRDVTWWALTGAAFFLAITLVLGVTLAGNLRWGYLGANRLLALGVHLHLALGGWVLLVIVGVADRLLPMFLLSHGVGDTRSRAAVALLAAGGLLLAFFHHGPPMVSRWAPALLMGVGLVCFLAQAARFYRKRVRPSLDPGLRQAAVALVVLASGLVLAVPVVAGWASPRVATAYVLVLVGGISLFIAALYYKIIPFLAWFHRFGPLAGKQRVPTVAELFSPGTARIAGALLASGVVGLAIGVLAGEAVVVRTAAVVFGAGVFIEGMQLLHLARRRAG